MLLFCRATERVWFRMIVATVSLVIRTDLIQDR